MRRVGLAVVASLALPGSAAAADRYVAPDGAGTACTATQRCSLRQGVDGAVSGDQVLVAGGTYDLGEQPLTTRSRAVTLRGEVTGPRRPLVVAGADVVLAGNARAVDLGFRITHGALRIEENATADRVASRSDGYGCLLQGSGAITNSLCVADDPELGAGGILAIGGVSARGVTAVGRGPMQTGVTVLAGSALTLTGVALAAGAERKDLEVNGSSTTVSTVASVFDSASGITAQNYTQTQRVDGAPVFRDEAALDFRQATGSRTIDLDSTSRAERDLNGNLRTLGLRTDAGAYEDVPAAPAPALTQASAAERTGTAMGTIVTRGGAVDVTAVWTPAAGGAPVTSVPVRILPEDLTTAVPVLAPVAGLTPGTEYRVQLSAASDGGTTVTPAVTVRTVAEPVVEQSGGGGTAPAGGGTTPLATTTPGGTAPPTTTPTPGGTPAPPEPATLAVSLKRSGSGTLRRTTVRRSGLPVRMGCGALACTVKLSATVKAGKRRVGTLRATSVEVAAGKTVTVRLKTTAALRKALLKKRTLTLTVTASARTTDGRTARRTLTLRAR